MRGADGLSSPAMTRPDDFQPPAVAFGQEFEVSRGDIDLLGHLNNVVWLRWVQDMAVAHSDASRPRLTTLPGGNLRAFGAVWVVRRHDIEYLAPAYAGERVTGTTWIGESGKTSSQRRTIFTRESDGRLLCRAKTTWVLVGTDGRPTEVPEHMQRAYAGARDRV